MLNTERKKRKWFKEDEEWGVSEKANGNIKQLWQVIANCRKPYGDGEISGKKIEMSGC